MAYGARRQSCSSMMRAAPVYSSSTRITPPSRPFLPTVLPCSNAVHVIMRGLLYVFLLPALNPIGINKVIIRLTHVGLKTKSRQFRAQRFRLIEYFVDGKLAPIVQLAGVEDAIWLIGRVIFGAGTIRTPRIYEK